MERWFQFGGAVFGIHCPTEFTVSPLLEQFEVPGREAAWDIFIFMGKPRPFSGLPVYENEFCRFYENAYIEMKGRNGVPIASFEEVEGSFRYTISGFDRELTGWLSLLPMPWLLSRENTLLFHASRIELGGKAILFSGPSGSGKTTQSRLWHDVLECEILNNDRTLLYRSAGQWMTSGYFEDGDAPVASPKAVPLGAVVFLAHEAVPTCLQLHRPLGRLVSQTLFTAWGEDSMEKTLELVGRLAGETPVYLLSGRPGPETVYCLQQILRKEILP